MLFSTIHEVLSIEIRRANNQSSSTRRGLHVNTTNEGFPQISKGGDFEKSIFLGLGGVLEISFGSTKLQEVEILPILVYSYFLWIKNLLRGCLD